MDENRSGKLRARLWQTALKVRAIGHLIECQETENSHPFDINELNHGLGLLIHEQGDKLHRIWQEMDKASVKKSETPNSN